MAAWRRMGYVVAVVLLFLTASHSVSLKMLDEEVYIRAGAQQWSGVPPALTINPEHPPLAKYIIGIAPHVVPTVAGLAVVFLSGWLGRLLGKSFWLVAFSVASDIVFTVTSRFAMLDIFVALFSVSAVLAYLLDRRWLSGVLWGAALASKFTAVFPLLGFIAYLAYRDRRGLGPVAVGVALVFLASHAVDIANGVFLFHFKFYWWLASFHSQ